MLLRQDFAICFCLISAIVTGASQASNVVVPDDVPTVQLALDSFADTVLVKSGVGLESPTIRRGVVLRGAEANVTLPELASLLLDLTGESYTGAVRIEGLHVMGQVRVQTSEQWVSLLSFTQCQLDSGLIHNYSQDE